MSGGIEDMYAERGSYPAHVGEHYNAWQIGSFIVEQNLSFYEGNIVKYVCRYKKKDGLKDLLKARDYLNQLIDNYNPK